MSQKITTKTSNDVHLMSLLSDLPGGLPCFIYSVTFISINERVRYLCASTFTRIKDKIYYAIFTPYIRKTYNELSFQTITRSN